MAVLGGVCSTRRYVVGILTALVSTVFCNPEQASGRHRQNAPRYCRESKATPYTFSSSASLKT